METKKLKQVKILGGIGSILFLASAIPFISFLGIAGVVLLLIAIYRISRLADEKRIFSDALWWLIISALAGIVAIIVGGVTLFKMFGGQLQTIPQFSPAIIISIIVLWGGMIAGAVFLKRSLVRIGEILDVKQFETAGKLFLWGAILLVLLVGALISFIGLIFLIVAFFSMPDSLPAQAGLSKKEAASEPIPPSE